VIRPTIIDKYVFKEIAASSLFCFAVFLIAGIITGFLPLLQKFIEKGLAITLILFQVLISALPSTLVTVLPLSIMIGILLGLGRMTADNEVAALKSSGISVVRLLPPVIFLGLIGLALSLLCTFVLVPKGITQGRRLMKEAATKGINAGIEERTFFDSIKNLVIYVESIDPSSGVMERVFIRETSRPNEILTILAEQGKPIPDPEGKNLILGLHNGIVIRENKNGDFINDTAFGSWVVRYPIAQTGLEGSKKSWEESSVSEIWQRLKEFLKTTPPVNPQAINYRRRVITIAHTLVTQRYTHPLACLALAFMAFPLGLLNLGKSRLNNVSVGLVVIFFYFAFTLATERAARSGLALPELVLPLPFVVFVISAAYLVRLVRLERIPALTFFVQRFLRRPRQSRS
jgi:lipopolysaccharide export system permease protein